MKPLKKFWIEVTALIAGIVVLFFVLEKIYAGYVTPVDSLIHGFSAKKENAEILFLGNSHTVPVATAAGADDMMKNSASFAFGGMDLFWSTVLLKKYANEMPSLKTVIIGIDEELMGYNQHVFRQEYLNRAFYRYTDTLYDMSLMNRMMASSNFFRSNRDLAYLFGSRDQPTDTLPLLHGVGKTRNRTYLCRLRALEHSELRFDKSLVGVNSRLIEELIFFAHVRKIHMIIFNPPKSSCYKRFVNQENINWSKAALNELLAGTGVVYIDMNDGSFDDFLFHDPDHLNFDGAKELISRLKKELSKAHFSEAFR